jgi:hypothetical protein
VEASRKHGAFDPRWPCSGKHSLGAIPAARSLPTLSESRANTYHRQNDARRLERAGAQTERPQEMMRLEEAEVAAGVAVRDVQYHRGLFRVRLDRPRRLPAAAQTLTPRALGPGHTRGAQTDRHEDGLHRYCSGCVHETEHVAWAADGLGSIASIRWPTAQPTTGTTICLACGQWRPATSQARPPSWSSWPRSPIATPSLSIAHDSADGADDSASEKAAENEGMPPQREPRRPRRSSTRLRRVPVAR